MQYFAQRFNFFFEVSLIVVKSLINLSPQKDNISSILTVSNLQLIKC